MPGRNACALLCVFDSLGFCMAGSNVQPPSMLASEKVLLQSVSFYCAVHEAWAGSAGFMQHTPRNPTLSFSLSLAGGEDRGQFSLLMVRRPR